MFDGKNLHTLIAGVSGSGKSTLLRMILDQIAEEDPDASFVLIDPRRTELKSFRHMARVVYYAKTLEEIETALDRTTYKMECRFAAMDANDEHVSSENNIFVVVDEMAFLMQGPKRKEYVALFNDIALTGRAARIHLILCTQVATQDVIPACIRDNMSNVVCLRQRDKGKYRYLLGDYYGRLPEYGMAYVFTPDMWDKPEKLKVEDVWSRIVGA